MPMSSLTNRCRRIFTFLNRHCKSPARILIVACSLSLVVTLSLVLQQPSTPVVHAASTRSKDSGAALFHEKGCEHCHGVDGRDGDLGPDLSTVGKRLKRQQIEHQIHDGGAAMPAFGDVLQSDEIKDLVDFLQAKRKAPKKVVPPVKSPAGAP
jgi:mono/diheme cytochrome c family protein